MKDDAYQTMNDWLTPNGIHHPEPYIGMKLKVKGEKRFNEHHQMIWDVYKKDKNSVNDEADLFAAVCEHKWNYDLSLKENLGKCPRMETLSRRRRELQEAGLITYSPKAMKKREEAFSNERDRHSTSPTVKIVKGEKVVNIAKEIQQEMATALKDARFDRAVEQQGLF